MKIAQIVSIVTLIAITGGGAFWFGKQSNQAPGANSTASSSASASPGPSAPKAPTGAPSAPNASAGPPPIAVQAAQVVSRPLPVSITTVGSLRSDEAIVVRPEVSGRISHILFKEGQRVNKGMLLLRLDASVPQAETDQAKANQLLARAKFDRSKELSAKGFVSGQALDEASNNLKVADSAVSLALAKLARTEIRAPFSGTIGLRSVSVGDYVREAQELVNLEETDPLKVDFRVPESFSSQVKAGQTLEVTLDTFPNQRFAGKVTAINPAIDAAGRAIVIRAVVDNKSATLKPGMFARVRLLLNENRESLMVPEQSLLSQGEDQFLFKVIDSQARRSPVAIGQRRDGMVEVLKGVSATDVIVIAGIQKLRDGAAIKVESSTTATKPVEPTQSGPSKSTEPVKPAAASAINANGAAKS